MTLLTVNERFNNIKPCAGRILKAYMIKEDLICFEYQNKATITKDDIIEAIKIQEEMIGDRLVNRLILTGNRTGVSPEARRYLAKFGLAAKKEAFIIHNFTQKMMYNLYYSVRRASHPVRTFESLDKAMEWLDKD